MPNIVAGAGTTHPLTLEAIYQALLGRSTFAGSQIREAFGGVPKDFLRDIGFSRFKSMVEGKVGGEFGSQLRAGLPKLNKLLPIKPGALSVPVQPGLAHEEFLLGIGLQEMIANLQAELERESQADVRRLQEAQLGANPADFVAYELYKRSLQEQGFTSEGPVRSDEEIQEMVSLALGLEGGPSAGVGQFGVEIPSTGAISRSELQAFSPTDVGILSSFLRGGVETDGGFQGINPEDFFTELEEGFIPTLTPQRTQFRF